MPATNRPQGDRPDEGVVRIALWSEGDLALDQQMLGDPAMTRYLGGPESDEQIARRHARKLLLPESGTGRMFKIIHEATGAAVGSVGYWENTWHDEAIYEMGWMVLPAFQGRGIASAATAQAIAQAKGERKHQFLHAFPAVANAASNALCRKLGFTQIEEFESEYPKGKFMQCNDWRLDLFAAQY